MVFALLKFQSSKGNEGILKTKITTFYNKENLYIWWIEFACNIYLTIHYPNMLTHCTASDFFTYFLLCSGQRKLWGTVLFIISVSPQGPHIALEMSVGSLLWRGALTFPPHPHWQPMCQLVAFSAGVGVWEVENTGERETEEKEQGRERVFEPFWMCVWVCVVCNKASDLRHSFRYDLGYN